jgi:hypothetical protein
MLIEGIGAAGIRGTYTNTQLAQPMEELGPLGKEEMPSIIFLQRDAEGCNTIHKSQSLLLKVKQQGEGFRSRCHL